MRHTVPNFLIGIFCSLSTLIFAQAPAYFNYSIENGSPSNELYCLLEDRDGYIWIGSDAGIYRFNGINFKQYNSEGLKARSATGLIQAPSGKIYGYNFKNQLFVIEKDTLKVIEKWKYTINGVKADRSGNIWISGIDGTFRLDEKTYTPKKIISGKERIAGITDVSDDICSNELGTVFYHNGGQIIEHIGTHSNIYSFSKDYYSLPCGITSAAGVTWVITFDGEYIYQLKDGKFANWNSSALREALKQRKITDVYNINPDELWIATYSGLIRYDVQRDIAEIWYENTACSAVIEDSKGNTWIATLHDGLFLLPDIDVRYWSAAGENGNIKERLTAIGSDGNSIYAAGSSGYIATVRKENGQYNRTEHFPISDLGMLYNDPIDDVLYFNKVEVLYAIRNDQVSVVNPKMPPIKAMVRDEGGYLLLSSIGLFEQKDLSIPVDYKNAKIADDWFRDVVKSPFDDGYYLAANKGLYALVSDEVKRIISKVFLTDKQILSVAADDAKKIVYCFGSSGDLFAYNGVGQPKIIAHFEQQIRPYQIRYHEGSLYIPSNIGLIIYDPETDMRKVLNVHDGLPSNNVTGVLFDDDGAIWLATGKGIVRLPEKNRKKITQAKMILGDIFINGHKHESGSPVVLQFDDVFSVEADGITYASNGKFVFAYRVDLEGYDWVETYPSGGRIRLPNLPTGEYKLQFKVIDHARNDSINIETIKLMVYPPFWQRWWFYVLIVLAVAAIGYIIFRERIKVLRRKQREVLQKLKLENELRLTQQSALKAQMNPHFIFNVLNSIKGYIYESDKQNAIRYLTDFSRLVRKVLDMSSKTTVSLSEELDAVELYIHLEAMLLDSEFSYDIRIADEVDADFIKVPALLIQPYVENAFKHGLRHRKGAKALNMDIHYSTRDVLEIRITDNGVGRAASEAINKGNSATHESFASEASRKRLDLLNHRQKELVGVEIVDNFDEQGDPAGTTVIIRIHV